MARNALYHNDGDGKFTDVSQQAGILKPGGRYGLRAVAADFDNDGWPDIYVACDMTRSSSSARLRFATTARNFRETYSAGRGQALVSAKTRKHVAEGAAWRSATLARVAVSHSGGSKDQSGTLRIGRLFRGHDSWRR